MKSYKKTAIGGIISFAFGISCCWLSSLAIWVGGATIIGTSIKTIESAQSKLLVLGIVLLCASVFLYIKRKSVDVKKVVDS